MRRAIALTGVVIVFAAVPAYAQQPTLAQLLDRLFAYTGGYAERFSSVIAEEHYEQWTETRRPLAPTTRSGSARRSIKSDYALTQVSGTWVAYRDAYDVDGVRVRDREDRLLRLLSRGDDVRPQIAAILADNARFNIASDVVPRNINVPTLAIQFLHPDNRSRFTFANAGEESVDGHATRRITFRERSRPTLVRRKGNQDQPLRGTVWADPATGEIWRTDMTWEKKPHGNIAVTYGRVPGIDALVPLRMTETYEEGTTEIHGDAEYSNFRQFRTAGRLIVP